jgi:hypothetical protein
MSPPTQKKKLAPWHTSSQMCQLQSGAVPGWVYLCLNGKKYLGRTKPPPLIGHILKTVLVEPSAPGCILSGATDANGVLTVTIGRGHAAKIRNIKIKINLFFANVKIAMIKCFI